MFAEALTHKHLNGSFADGQKRADNALCESCNGEVDIGFWHFKEKNATFTF